MPSTVAGAGGARQRHGAQAVRAHGEAAEEHLDGGGALVVVGDEAVGEAQRRAVGGARAGHAHRRVAGAAEVLHERERPDARRPPARAAGRRPTPPPRPPARPSRARGRRSGPCARAACAERGPSRRQHPLAAPRARARHPSASRDEADLRPGRQQSGRGAGGVPERGVGAADQLPTAGRAAGVDAAELAREPDRPGRDARARLRPTLDVQPGIAAGQVGEAGREAAEPDPPRRAGVRGHHLVGVEPGELGDLGQVRAVVDDGDLDGLAVGRVDRRDVQRLDGPAQRSEVGARADGDHHGARSRHDVDHARPACRLDRGRVGEHGVEVGELHEDRRVPHRQHPRPVALRRVDDRLLRRTHAAPPPRRPVRRGRQWPSRRRRASPRARTPTRRGRPRRCRPPR